MSGLTQRRFSNQSATAAAAAGAAVNRLSAQASVPNANEKIRVALIGCNCAFPSSLS